MNPYIGHGSQLYGIEEHRLVGGKGDGLRLLEVNNGNGLEMTVSPDRNCDIARLRFDGVNLSYFSPCGYAAPAFYDREGTNFLKTFTAGFLTTCGLEAVGTPCTDEGEELPLHGSIANQPAEQVCWSEEADENGKALVISSVTRDEVIFGRKLVLSRKIRVSLDRNEIRLTDRIENTGDRREPLEILYHMNMGYPLLDEDSVVSIPSVQVLPRNEHAAEDLARWMVMEKPQAGYEEKCYYHRFDGKTGSASIWQPKHDVGLEITFDTQELDSFVEWKMMGVRDYVLGLECGNCYPDGRDVMRKKGMLKFLDPGAGVTYEVKVRLFRKA
ncbi:MAG: aldose 1-epimerase family protein [Lachnospiraceae bacterium]|jgi:hypothetical protein|nr:aldose 1-epimerase family protein [Lachnospiraceae bacterium]